MDDAGAKLADDHEARRLRALDALHAFGGDPADPRFDRIVRLASRLFGAPRAAIRLVGKDRVWLKAKVGFDHLEEPRPAGLAERMRESGVVAHPDLAADPDQTLRPWCADSRFFACAPLKTASGEIVGLLTVEDPAPRETVEPGLADALADLAALAMEELLHDAETARNVAERALTRTVSAVMSQTNSPRLAACRARAIRSLSSVRSATLRAVSASCSSSSIARAARSARASARPAGRGSSR